MNDIIGKKFGRLTVIAFHHREQAYYNNGKKNGFRYLYLCKCDCGNKCITRKDGLLTNKVFSCGCFRKEQAYKATFKKDKITKSRIYRIWSNIKRRCYNPKNEAYCNYGMRGITVCSEWVNDPQAFYKWAISNGYTDNLTIDRINNNGNYKPSNCRWVTSKIQSNNKRKNHLVTYQGVTHTLSEWSSIIGIKQSTIRARLKRGWDIKNVLSPRLSVNQYG